MIPSTWKGKKAWKFRPVERSDSKKTKQTEPHDGTDEVTQEGKTSLWRSEKTLWADGTLETTAVVSRPSHLVPVVPVTEASRLADRDHDARTALPAAFRKHHNARSARGKTQTRESRQKQQGRDERKAMMSAICDRRRKRRLDRRGGRTGDGRAGENVDG